MDGHKAKIEEVLRRAEETLQTAQHGLEDLLDSRRHRRMTGLRNLIVFGRSVTFVLQNLRSVIPDEFDRWYGPKQDEMKTDPLMRYFVEARNELEKQGKLSVATSAHIKSFSTNDLRKFGTPPSGAIGFFVGDQLGGSGWEIEFADGSIEKYYIDLPSSIGEVKQHFTNFPEAKAPELKGLSVEDLCKKFLERLSNLLTEAKSRFMGVHLPQSGHKFPPYLRRVK